MAQATQTLGSKVRSLRGELLLTQEQLATAAGVALETVNRVENGRHLPNARTTARLARALGVPATTLEQLREQS